MFHVTWTHATEVYGRNDGSTYFIAPATNSGYTYHASIDTAVSAGVTAGCSIMEFDGDWRGVSIDETINLRNDNLTFQGDVSMTWGDYAGAAFGDRNSESFSATIKNLSITTTKDAPQARGVVWSQTATAEHYGTLMLSNVTFNTTGDAVFMEGKDETGGGYATRVTLTVRDSRLISSGGSGIRAKTGQKYPEGFSTTSHIDVQNSRIEANQHGIWFDWAQQPAYNSLVVKRCEIISNSGSASSIGVGVRYNHESYPFVLIGSLVQGFGRCVSEESPTSCSDDDGTMSFFINNTIVGTGSSTGIVIRIGAVTAHSWDSQRYVLGNNIVAGHSVGLLVTEGATGGSMTIRGNNNALFANTNNFSTSGSVTIGDSGRVTPSYAMADAFVDPDNATLINRNYRLVADATALIDAGEQFQGDLFTSGTTQTWVDYDDNSSYTSGKDYIIDLGGYSGSTSGHNLLLYDADLNRTLIRVYNDNIDIGAYEYRPALGTVVVID